MSGRHRVPVEHHVGRAIATTGVAAAVTTGTFLAITPAQAHADLASHTPTTPSPVVQPPIPTPGPTQPAIVTVQPGNTLSGIATGVGESWPTLYDNNRAVIGADPNRIFPGQKLSTSRALPALVPASVVAPAPARVATSATPASPPAPVTPPPPAPTPAPTVPSTVGAVTLAQAELGKPYVWGGSGPSVFDCSGLVQFVYAKLGVNLPHSSFLQSQHGSLVTSLAYARPGDLVFFSSPVDHVGIYIGGGQMIAAPQLGEVVKQQSVYETPSVIRRVI